MIVNKTRIILRGFALAIAVLQAYAYRYTVYMEDAISYLDIAEYYLRGDFNTAINSYWSPLYSWLIALFFFCFHPEPGNVIVALKVINLICFLFVIFTFESLLNGVISWYAEDESSASGQNGKLKISSIFVEVSAYLVFIFVSFSIGGVWKDTPDLLMCGFLYAASALTLAIWRGKEKPWTGFLLGSALALGYLCKAVMFPIALVYLFLVIIAPRERKPKAKLLSVVAAAFLLLAAPYIATISYKNHRLMFSNTMQYNYALWVLRSAPFLHALLNRPTDGKPIEFLHPSEVIFPEPQVFFFAEPIHSTFATHYNPPFWYEGVRIYWDWESQFVASVATISVLVRLFFGWLLVGWLVLLFAGRGRKISLRSMKPRLVLFLPPLAGMTLYTIGLNCNTLYAERYFPGFFLLWFLGLLGSLRLPETARARKILLTSTAISLLGLSWRFCDQMQADFKMLEKGKVNVNYLIMHRLTELGVRAGDQLASLDPIRDIGWAQMGHFRIVAEIPDVDKFWQLYSLNGQSILTQLKERQIKAVTYQNGKQPPEEMPDGWQQVPGTKFWIYRL
jgi:hypothetical protein